MVARAVRSVVAIAATTAVSACAAASHTAPAASTATATNPAAAKSWADSVLATLSLRDKAAQMVWPWVLGD